MLKERFHLLLLKYSNDQDLISTLWQEIERSYSEKGRHYHTLTHLENLVKELDRVKQNICDQETILFAVFYHDIVYNIRKHNNEEESASLAEKRLSSIHYPPEKIKKCAAMIHATKTHDEQADPDINFFTDADLSVLGSAPENYENYFKMIRNEYSFYPDLLYNSGRRKVLKHFLDRKRIFKTDIFFEKYEEQARINLWFELTRL